MNLMLTVTDSLAIQSQTRFVDYEHYSFEEGRLYLLSK